MHRETKHKNGYIHLYFRSASKSSIVSSSSDSEDSNESEIDVHPNPPKKHFSSLNYLPSQDLESGHTTKSWKKLFPGSSLMKIYRMHSEKRVEDLFRGLVGLGLPNHSLIGRRQLRK